MSAVPVYLIAQPRWLLWRTKSTVDRKTGEKRTTKVPISYHTGKPAMSPRHSHGPTMPRSKQRWSAHRAHGMARASRSALSSRSVRS